MLGNGIEIYNPDATISMNLPSFRLLQLSRPTHTTRFIKHGEEVHLFVYLNSDAQFPFIRVPLEALLNSANQYVKRTERERR